MVLADLTQVVVVIAVLVLVLVLVLVAVAAFVARGEVGTRQDLHTEASAAAAAATACLGTSLDSDLDEAEIAARMSGLTEFFHTIPNITAAERRSGLPPLALAVASLVVVAGAVLAVVWRVEERRELEACAETAAALGAATTATSTSTTAGAVPTTSPPSPATAGATTTVAGATTTVAGPTATVAGPTPTAGATTATSAPSTTAAPGVANADRTSFLTTCRNGGSG